MVKPGEIVGLLKPEGEEITIDQAQKY